VKFDLMVAVPLGGRVQSYRLPLSVLWLLPIPLQENTTMTVDLFEPWCTFTVTAVKLKLSNRLPGVWDKQTPRGRFRGRLVKQLGRITVIVIDVFPVCVRVILCYTYNLSE
jgi:hypothetical protein